MTASPSSRTRHHRESTAFRREVLAFGRRVRALRKTKTWTVEEAAERFGVEPAFVRHVEAGRTNPSLAVIVSIAEAFDLLASELLLAVEAPRTKRTSVAR